MIATGATLPAIARALAVSEDTVSRHFQQEIQCGREDVNTAIGKSIATMALEGDRGLMMFYAKCRLGWSERSYVGQLDASGRPVDPPTTTFTISITTDDGTL
jgi:hypothetical protein